MADNKKRIRFKSIAILEAVIILILAVGLVWVGFIKGRNDAVPANSSNKPQVRRRAVIDKEESFYQLDGKKLLMHDSTYGEIFVPIYGDVPASDLDLSGLTMRNGYAYYEENGEIISTTGVDVSEFQGAIDWEQVKLADIDFAFIRVGYRTYGDGIITYDNEFQRNIEGAQKEGGRLLLLTGNQCR